MQVHTPPASKSRYTDRAVQRHPRTLFSVPFTFHHFSAGGVRTFHGITLDISQSGVGALVERVLPVGDAVQLDLKLPERQLSALAIVRHSSNLCSGFEFVGLTPEERLQISGIIGAADQRMLSSPCFRL
jgi:hypothetical protein